MREPHERWFIVFRVLRTTSNGEKSVNTQMGVSKEMFFKWTKIIRNIEFLLWLNFSLCALLLWSVNFYCTFLPPFLTLLKQIWAHLPYISSHVPHPSTVFNEFSVVATTIQYPCAWGLPVHLSCQRCQWSDAWHISVHHSMWPQYPPYHHPCPISNPQSSVCSVCLCQDSKKIAASLMIL